MIGWLLLGMLVLPTLGAIAARLLARRFDGTLPRVIAVLGFVAAALCALGVSRLPANAEHLGRLAILLPSNDVRIARASLLNPTPPAIAAQPAPAITAEPTPTPWASSAPTATPTPTPTATPAPTTTPQPTATVTPEPTATPQPTTTPEPTAAPRPAAEPRRYVVQPGDTLRAIAARFGVSVERLLEYNGLTPEEGDNLRVDQVLYIPPQ
ncbi:LysM peptidoglycan-binding domain-containing protein [Kallotenue papyrolyticum]|uniref:LysM peptidoglycan-binding domain-containing protein n=1 Tax=Kallotenue papyrolyticum TaxID=1325125 RepID=UPI00049237AB|nr:LysM peptidoglycan-binding domain-containing protein [Kallotenue papyrolyticum]